MYDCKLKWLESWLSINKFKIYGDHLKVLVYTKDQENFQTKDKILLIALQSLYRLNVGTETNWVFNAGLWKGRQAGQASLELV